MPFGLSGALSSFCRVMSIHCFARRTVGYFCLCYLDDIIIYGRTPQELLERIRKILDLLRAVGMKLKPSKCVLFKTEIEYLGHVVSANGIDPQPQKIQAIQDWLTPHCVCDVRAFYGLASYYRKFVNGFATIAEPLTRLTKNWLVSFGPMRPRRPLTNLNRLSCRLLLWHSPTQNCPEFLTSDVALGAVLSQ